MAATLNLFPVRVPIGAVQPNGDVLMTPEFSRALSALMVRVGGASAMSLDEVLTLCQTDTTSAATSAANTRAVTDLVTQLAVAPLLAARIVVLEQKIEDLARQLVMSSPAPVDWEHPGRLGDKTPNTARVTTLNKITFTQPAASATFTLANGKTFTVSNTLTLAGVDGKTLTVNNTLTLAGTDASTLNIGGGGTLGSAAYQNTSAFAARSGTALAAVATDPASTQALANSLRSVLISVGIGT
jgi:hypothetical protein